MIQVIPSSERYHADHGWLDTHWHFSFSDYHDAKNMNWSALRVFNDDIIRGGGGFGLHPHRDMEIVTYVIDGQLEHQDHLGNRGIVHSGEVQVMSAGRGIMHAEYNASDKDDVRLLQLWVLPRHQNNQPRWEQRQFAAEQRQGRFLPVVSSGDVQGTLAIDQDATIYVSSLEAGERLVHESKPGRHAYLFVIRGGVSVNNRPLATGDQARIADEPRLEIRADQAAELMLLDLP